MGSLPRRHGRTKPPRKAECNLDAEKALVGAILRDNGAIPAVRRLVGVEDFTSDALRRLFAVIEALTDAGIPADPVTVGEWLKRRGELDDVRPDYIAELWNAAPAPQNVEYYARIVREAAAWRGIADLAGRAAAEVQSPAGTAAEALARFTREAGVLVKAAAPGGKAGADEIDGADLLAEPAPAVLECLPLLGRDGYFVIGWSHLLAGYPRTGKTELLVRCIPEWLRLGQRVLLFTEEPREMWRQRLHNRPGPWRGLRLVFALGNPPAEMLARMAAAEEEVVCVDTIRNLGVLGPDENDNAAIAAAVAPWVAAGRRTHKTLVMLHHMRKGAGEHGEGISGGHALLGAVDVALELRRDSRPNRRLVKGYARLIQPADVLYEQEKGGGFRVLGDPAGVMLDTVRERVRLVLGSEWVTAADVMELLEDPKPSGELLRQALKAEAEAGGVERDPPITATDVRGKRHRWRAKGEFQCP
jgi:hypothetical protein